jgi:hypothetical protein
MAYELPIPFTHKTPINYNDMLFPKIVHDKDISFKATLKETLVRQTLFQGKRKLTLQPKTL